MGLRKINRKESLVFLAQTIMSPLSFAERQYNNAIFFLWKNKGIEGKGTRELRERGEVPLKGVVVAK